MKKRIVMGLIAAAMMINICACDSRENNADNITSEQAQQSDVRNTQAESEDSENTEEETQNQESENADYSLVTHKSADEVEEFAKLVTDDFENADWESLADKIYYPITINDKYYADKEAFLKTNWSEELSDEFIDGIVKADTKDLFCNWSGIMISNGAIWFLDVDDELKIISINYNDGKNKADASSGIVGHWKPDMEKTEANLKNYSSLQEMFGTGIQVGGNLEIKDDNTFSMDFALAINMTGTYNQDENTINIKGEDERGNETNDTMTFEMIDDNLYIISPYEGEEIYWTKLAE